MRHRLHQLCCVAFVLVTALVYVIDGLPAGSRGKAYIILHLLLSALMLGAWSTTGAENLAWLLGSGALARVLLLPAPAFTSTDVARYLWDGRVALAGLDPYRVVPADPSLAALRATWLPPGVHLELPTLYPPGALGLFSLAALAGGPWAAGVLWKLLVTAASLATLGVTARLLLATRTGRHLALVALSPLLVLEAGVGGHVDAFSTLALAAALMLAVGGGQAAAGGLLALGATVKVLPALAAVPLATRAASPWRLLLGFASVGAGVYVGTLALGIVPIGSIAVPFRSWSFGSPLWFSMEAILGRNAATLVGVLAVVSLLILSVRLARNGSWSLGVQVALAAPLLVSPVVHPWYLMPLVPAVALAPNAAALAWITAAPLTYVVLDRLASDGVWAPAPWPLVAIAVAALAGLVADAIRWLAFERERGCCMSYSAD